MYLVVDMNSDYKEKMDYKGIKKLLIETIQEDLLMNYGEYEIVKDCTNELVKIAKEEWIAEKWIIDLLESYSYKVIDLLQFQRDLEDLREYYAPNKDTIAINFNTILDIVNKGVNEK